MIEDRRSLKTAEGESKEGSDDLCTPQADPGSEVQKPLRQDARQRTDRGRLHALRTSILSRGLLEGLQRRGENLRALRKMERELRNLLKPKGVLGRLFFDRFWSSYLRLVLVGRLEETGLASSESVSTNSASVPSLRQGVDPILMLPSEAGNLMQGPCSGALDSEMFRRLALISRYDRAASRELYRSLGLLLLMRDGGEAGLKSWVRIILGFKGENGAEGKNA